MFLPLPMVQPRAQRQQNVLRRAAVSHESSKKRFRLSEDQVDELSTEYTSWRSNQFNMNGSPKIASVLLYDAWFPR